MTQKLKLKLKSISQIQNTKTGDRDYVSATQVCLLLPMSITISINETWQTKRCFLWSRRTCLIICCLHWRMMCCAQTATTCALPFGMKQRSFLAHLQSTTIQDQNLCLCFWRRMRGGWMSNTCVQSSCSWTHCCQRRRSSPLLIAGRGSYKEHKRGIWTPQPPPDCVASSGRTLCVVIWTQWPGRGGLQEFTDRKR